MTFSYFGQNHFFDFERPFWATLGGYDSNCFQFQSPRHRMTRIVWKDPACAYIRTYIHTRDFTQKLKTQRCCWTERGDNDAVNSVVVSSSKNLVNSVAVILQQEPQHRFISEVCESSKFEDLWQGKNMNININLVINFRVFHF